MNFSLVALAGLGASVGAVLRYLFMQLGKRLSCQPLLPWTTLLINLSGSFLLGWLMGGSLGQTAKLFMGAGILGGFTTFSTMVNEAVLLTKNHHLQMAIGYIMLSVVGGLACAWLGFVVL